MTREVSLLLHFVSFHRIFHRFILLLALMKSIDLATDLLESSTELMPHGIYLIFWRQGFAKSVSIWSEHFNIQGLHNVWDEMDVICATCRNTAAIQGQKDVSTHTSRSLCFNKRDQDLFWPHTGKFIGDSAVLGHHERCLHDVMYRLRSTEDLVLWNVSWSKCGAICTESSTKDEDLLIFAVFLSWFDLLVCQRSDLMRSRLYLEISSIHVIDSTSCDGVFMMNTGELL